MTHAAFHDLHPERRSGQNARTGDGAQKIAGDTNCHAGEFQMRGNINDSVCILLGMRQSLPHCSQGAQLTPAAFRSHLNPSSLAVASYETAVTRRSQYKLELNLDIVQVFIPDIAVESSFGHVQAFS